MVLLFTDQDFALCCRTSVYLPQQCVLSARMTIFTSGTSDVPVQIPRSLHVLISHYKRRFVGRADKKVRPSQ